ncbi:MAG: hypothetical protein JSR46_12560, partial [Verrucomicrobia bacterium]|nr:hypothetical protein [Verrucomicrobiota bacterium]
MISFVLIALSFLCVTFGQPSGYSLSCILTSVAAFGLFFRTICSFSTKNRFLTGFAFFFCVQAVQLFWFTFHPFLYIWGVYLLLCLLIGLQFGLLSLAASKRILSSRFSWLLLPALWVMMEWSRLFWLSGFCFNFVGLSATDNIFTLQMASLGGMLGLTFWVMLTNTTFSRLLLLKTKSSLFLFCSTAIIPYLFGIAHLNIHTKEMLQYDKDHPPLTSLIVHQRVLPAVSVGERSDPIKKAFHQWQEIITAIGPHRKEKIDLLLTPE